MPIIRWQYISGSIYRKDFRKVMASGDYFRCGAVACGYRGCGGDRAEDGRDRSCCDQYLPANLYGAQYFHAQSGTGRFYPLCKAYGRREKGGGGCLF